MSTQSKIEWTEQTWNPTVGCTKISPGCKNCYAETMSRRLKAMGVHGYENGFRLTLMPDRLAEPHQLSWHRRDVCGEAWIEVPDGSERQPLPIGSLGRSP